LSIVSWRMHWKRVRLLSYILKNLTYEVTHAHITYFLSHW
jgi:hypothetical protein